MTNGQIAYEGYFKSCGGRSLISGALLPNWDGQDVLIQAAWEQAAAAVLAAQWKPVSERPSSNSYVLVTDGSAVSLGFFESGMWFCMGYPAYSTTHWRELPPLPSSGEINCPPIELQPRTPLPEGGEK